MSNIEKLIKELCPDGVEYKELKSVFEMRNGYTPSKAKAEFWEGGTIPWFRMEDIRENGNILSDSAQHITPAAVKGKLFPANSIIVATSATIGEHALITVESLANQRFTYLVRRPEYEEKLDPKFVYYYCYKLDEWCLNNTNISSFPSVDMAKFDEYKEKYNFPSKGTVLISAAGTIGRTVVYNGESAYFQDSNIVWIDNNETLVTNKYLAYCYSLKPWNVAEGGTIQRLYNDNLMKAIIAVPSIEEQNRITTILDRFDTLCNDLTKGLPAEIEARQKQYEYYRDKLLTFKELGA